MLLHSFTLWENLNLSTRICQQSYLWTENITKEGIILAYVPWIRRKIFSFFPTIGIAFILAQVSQQNKQSLKVFSCSSYSDFKSSMRMSQKMIFNFVALKWGHIDYKFPLNFVRIVGWMNSIGFSSKLKAEFRSFGTYCWNVAFI